MSEKIYYVIFFEGNMFQAFGDYLSGSKCINKEGPFLFEKEAAERSMRHTRACIVYNAAKQSFLNDTRHANYAYDAVHNLVSWAKKNIPIITRRKSVVSILETIPEYPCESSPLIITEDVEPIKNEPINNEPIMSIVPASANTVLTPALPRWCFFEQNSIHHEQEDLDIRVEIANIAEKVFTAIKAYGGDFYQLPI